MSGEKGLVSPCLFAKLDIFVQLPSMHFLLKEQDRNSHEEVVAKNNRPDGFYRQG
jgi:hypothetical protein